jgi:hydroxyacylglutathione hydrolase
MLFERVETPGLAHVAYVIGDQGEAAVVDPRRDVERYLEVARRNGCALRHALVTHRQEDFELGTAELARRLGAKVVTGRREPEELTGADQPSPGARGAGAVPAP